MNIKKILALSVGAVLLGATLTGCGISKENYNQVQGELQTKNAQVSDLTTQINSLNEQVKLNQGDTKVLKEQLAIKEAELKAQELVLTEKDKEVIKYNTEIAQAEAEKLAKAEAIDEIELGSDVSGMYDHYDMSFLNKDKVNFNDEDYNYREIVYLDGLKVATTFTDEDFKADPYLLFNEVQGVTYYYQFEEQPTYSEITEDEPLNINFLGKEFQIVKAEPDKITYKSADSRNVLEGQTIEYKDYKITLDFVTESKVSVSVKKGENVISHSITEDDTWTFGDLQVRAKELLYQPYAGGVHQATLELGKDVLKTVETDDEYVKDDENFIWWINADSGKLNGIGITYDVKANDLDEPILGIDKSLNFADYFNLKFTYDKKYDYKTFDLSFDEITDADIPAIEVKTTNEDIKVGDERVKKAYFDGVNSWYKNDENDWVSSLEPITLINGDYEKEFTYTGGYFKTDNFGLNTLDFKKLGTLAKVDEAIDVKDFETLATIGSQEGDYLLQDGTILVNLEGNSESDQVKIKLPSEQVKTAIQIIKK